MLDEALDRAAVDAAVFALRPDYRAMLLAVDGIEPGPGDRESEALLEEAEAASRAALDGTAPEELPCRLRVAAREPADRPLQRGLGAAPGPARRRGPHALPGGPRLVRATGAEDFETVADGAAVVEHPDPGEVVWRDDAGVTCRRWNWRQARRTHLDDETTTALFILDALGPMTDATSARPPTT